jgi:hypothetical protein
VALSPKYVGRPAAEETINDPNNPRHYWRYRIHYTLEDVLEDEPLISDLQALLLGGCWPGASPCQAQFQLVMSLVWQPHMMACAILQEVGAAAKPSCQSSTRSSSLSRTAVLTALHTSRRTT